MENSGWRRQIAWPLLEKQGLDFRWTKKRTGKKEQKTRGGNQREQTQGRGENTRGQKNELRHRPKNNTKTQNRETKNERQKKKGVNRADTERKTNKKNRGRTENNKQERPSRIPFRTSTKKRLLSFKQQISWTKPATKENPRRTKTEKRNAERTRER